MLTVRRATPEELDTCLAIRMEVFVLGQGVPQVLEVDGQDPRCAHWIAWFRKEPVGTARLRITPDGKAKAERVAVRQGYRARGIGAALMAELEQEAARLGHRQLVLSAQTHVIPFYERLGYEAYGDVFIDAAIPHRMMRKPLEPQ